MPTIKDRSVGLSDSQWNALKSVAERTDRPVSWHVRQAVGHYLSSLAWRPGQDPADRDAMANYVFEQENAGWLAERAETRDPDDEEARLLREAFPQLKNPTIVDPNTGRKR